MKKFAIPFLAATALTLAACSSEEETTPQQAQDNAQPEVETLSVYTTVYPLEYFTERIGGEFVTVESVYPPGADEHTFEPSQQDMIKFADADRLFAIGLGLESFISSAKDTLANQQVEIVELADFISDDMLVDASADEHTEEGHSEDEHAEEGHSEDEHAEDGHSEDEHAEDGHSEDEHAEEGHSEDEHAEEGHSEDSHAGHDHGALDPHLWISPTLSVELAKSIRNELVEASPENEEFFNENFAALEEDILALDASFEEVVAEANRDTFFVSHAAFGYWVKDYGLNQVAVAGISTQDEPSQKELASLVDQAREQQIDYILTEQNVSSKLTDIIRSEVGAETLPLHNLGVLTDEDIANEENYLTLMERNIETLRTALQ
ncbi:zinc ABC transporter substrate-binding protein [Chryseomicrobium sp. FSL W7-1435]|uniref:metal ABC transporter solute-binding protein, Zn/Mn family n=1 Tax=Chryseomicrobium sp. FSL W7-1435 TaxID=2921704 RepID=UPI00315A457B